MNNYLRTSNLNIETFQKIVMIGALALLTACGEATTSGKGGDGVPPSPESLADFVEIIVSGSFEGIQTNSNQQDQDAFFAKNSKAAMTACVTDKFKNDPNFELEKNMDEASMDEFEATVNQYRGKLNDDNPIFEVIKKYGVKELNTLTKMAYDAWVMKGVESFLACTVQ
jgi:hypothetical protein